MNRDTLPLGCKPLSFLDALTDLYKDPSEFDTDYTEFCGPEAIANDWKRVGDGLRNAMSKLDDELNRV